MKQGKKNHRLCFHNSAQINFVDFVGKISCDRIVHDYYTLFEYEEFVIVQLLSMNR